MELGALICTPKQPKCPLCPVRIHCKAYRIGRVHEFPNLTPRIAATQRHFVAFIIPHRGRFLVQQRPAGVVNAHLWEFPNLEITASNPNLIQLVRDQLGLSLTDLAEHCTIKHTITRYRITLQAFHAKTSRVPLAGRSVPGLNDSTSRWLALVQLNALPFTSAHRKILHRLGV